MERIWDKGILFMCCTICFLYRETDRFSYIVLFTCMSISCLYEYNKKIFFLRISAVVFLAGMFLNPVFIIFFPVLLYDLFYEKEWTLVITGTAVPLFLLAQRPSELPVFILMVGVIAVMLSNRTRQYLLLSEEYRKQRDVGRELELVLKGKNHELMEKRDYEIHVATLRERNRIAREIHDNVGHMLSRSILQVGALKAVSQERAVQEQLGELAGTLNQAMNNIRQSVHDLHDESLDLNDSIVRMLKDYGDYEVFYDYELSASTPKEIKYCFLTVIREALSNVVKHSDADKISITIREFSQFYQMVFLDNGSRYQKKAIAGLGLDNMKERVAAFRGNINIQTGQGFKIFISIPKIDKGGVIS